MEIVCGDWKAKKDVRCRMGVSVFTVPERAIVNVSQFDSERRKVLVSAGPRDIDWLPLNFLDDFEPVI